MFCSIPITIFYVKNFGNHPCEQKIFLIYFVYYVLRVPSCISAESALLKAVADWKIFCVRCCYWIKLIFIKIDLFGYLHWKTQTIFIRFGSASKAFDFQHILFHGIPNTDDWWTNNVPFRRSKKHFKLSRIGSCLRGDFPGCCYTHSRYLIWFISAHLMKTSKNKCNSNLCVEGRKRKLTPGKEVYSSKGVNCTYVQSLTHNCTAGKSNR